MSEKTRQTSKIFVGGLSWETTDQRLRTYFENYGAVSEAFVSFDRTTGRPRGFGFVVFEDPAVADKVVSLQHTIDRRDVEAKKAVPKEEHPAGKQPNGVSSQRTKKIFVGGLAPSVDEHAFKKYFEQYGAVEDAVVMYDHDNKRPRGFGFVTFISEEGVDAVFMGGSLQTLHDKPIEIKRAVPRDQIATARGRPAFAQQPRMFTATPQAQSRIGGGASGQSGFAAAAMGPAFGGDPTPLAGSLISSHSLGAPGNQNRVPNLTCAASLGAQGLPHFSHDLSALSQGFAAGLLSAMSGQLGSQLSTQLSTALSTPANGLQQMGSSQLPNSLAAGGGPPIGANQLQTIGSGQLPSSLQPAGSHQLQSMGSQQLQSMGSQQLQQMSSMHLQGGAGLAGMGSSGLQSASSGLLQGNYGLANGDALSPADYASMHHHAHPHQPGRDMYNAAATSGLQSAFAGMALESQPSFGTELPPPNGFEERVNMLSAGSAGLGQLPSPKLPPGFGATYAEVHGNQHNPATYAEVHGNHSNPATYAEVHGNHNNAARDVAVSGQPW